MFTARPARQRGWWRSFACALPALLLLVLPALAGADDAAAASPPGGGPAIRVEGSRFVDAAGKTVRLRGVNFSGLEFVAIQGWNPADPSGGMGGRPNGPDWNAIRAWHANVVRLPLNEASWLGYSCKDTAGDTHNPDPGHNYRAAVAALVKQANSAGLYVILDLHWSAPGSICPMLQTQMADADHAIDFWSSVAAAYKDNPAVMFELYNEPFFDFDFDGDAWATMMSGRGGSFSGLPATGDGGHWQHLRQPWKAAGFQQMIDAVRATGAANVVLVSGLRYAQDLSGWLANRPTDPRRQMAATWHAYPTFGAKWENPCSWRNRYCTPNYSPQIFDQVKAILAAGTPVLITETGDQNTPGTMGAPLVATVTEFADRNGLGVIGWCWDLFHEPSNVLIKDADGTPTDGYGRVFHDWMVRQDGP